MNAISEQGETDRDAAFATIGLAAEVVGGRMVLLWREIRTTCSARFWNEVPFPGLAETIQARMVEKEHGQVKIGGRVYDVVPAQQARTIKIPTDDT